MRVNKMKRGGDAGCRCTQRRRRREDNEGRGVCVCVRERGRKKGNSFDTSKTFSLMAMSS
jgi:hypothetical protein